MTARRKPDPLPDPEPVVAMVPLSQLYLHEFNVRSEPPEADIAALAESIRAVGLMQNLSGYADGIGPINGDPLADTSHMIGIVAGGRRLRALRLIAGTSDPTVPVRVTQDEGTARLWASAENTAREALHPADEITAYGKMAGTGADPNAIARAFAVTESHVRKRLKLAGLPAPALAALRAGRISLDQAAALTVARTPLDAERALDEVLNSNWPLGPDRIRGLLQQATVPATDRRAVFVGLDTYQAAGGEVQADLFTDRTALLDAALLDRLFAEKLDAAASAERGCGWKWVETATARNVWELPTTGLQAIQSVPLDLQQADQDELDELERLGETDEWTQVQADRFEELCARAAGDFAPADVATSGVFVYVNGKGELVVTDPYRKPEDRPGSGAAKAEDGTVETRPAETKALPAALLEDLYRIRRAALEAELIDCPGLMLDLLAYSLSGGFWAHNAPVMMQPTAAIIAPEKPEGFDPPARLASFDPKDYGRATPSVEGFKAFRETYDSAGVKVTRPKRELTLAIARCIRPHSPLEAYLASRVNPNVRAIWTPTKDGYFARLPAPVLDAIWAELVPQDLAPRTWAELKKAQKAAELHDLFNSADYREALGLSRDTADSIHAWLPPELQWPEVEGEEGEA